MNDKTQTESDEARPEEPQGSEQIPAVVRRKQFDIKLLNMFDIQIYFWTWRYEMFYSKCFVDGWIYNINIGLFAINWK